MVVIYNVKDLVDDQAKEYKESIEYRSYEDAIKYMNPLEYFRFSNGILNWFSDNLGDVDEVIDYFESGNLEVSIKVGE